MEYIKLNIKLCSRPEIMAAGDRAAWLYVCASCYAMEHRTDGLIPAQVLPTLAQRGAKALARRLVEVGLWEAVEGGWRIVGYLDEQLSREEIDRRRKGNADRQKRHSQRVTNASDNALLTPLDTRYKKKILEVGSSEPTSVVPLASPDVVRLCHLLADLIRGNDPKASVAPDGKAWRDAARRLLERDGRTVEEVEEVIRWCQADDFWQANVLSMPKLRKQFSSLLLQMRRPSRTTEHPADVLDRELAGWQAEEREPRKLVRSLSIVGDVKNYSVNEWPPRQNGKP